MLKIGLLGASGRVGRLLIEEIISDEELQLSSVFLHRELDFVLPAQTFVSNDCEAFMKHCDLVIDFSMPVATHILLQTAQNIPIPIVSGTTGLEQKTFDLMKQISSDLPILHASNMSIGIAALNSVVAQLSCFLKKADIEICEIHHRYKKDAPSGTAITLAESCSKARGLELSKVGVYSREGENNARRENEIGVMSLRGGDIAGRHTVGFYMNGEYLELTHNATSRSTFAKGAIDAAKWLATQKNGFYKINDIFQFQV